MKNTTTSPKTLAKEIRASLKTQHAYLNQQLSRIRIFDARSTRDGALLVKVIQNTPGQLHHGRVAWLNVRADQSVTIYAATVMEETFTVGGI